MKQTEFMKQCTDFQGYQNWLWNLKTTSVQNWLWNLKQLLLHCLDNITRLFITFAQADFLPCMLQFLIRIFIYLWCFHWVKSRLRFVWFSPSALKTFWIYFHPNTTTARELPHENYRTPHMLTHLADLTPI